MEKITKKNSILYNQLWINKAIEEGHMDFLPIFKSNSISIGEYIEMKYEQYEKNIPPSKTTKITKHNSLLFEIEWIRKATEDNIRIPKPTTKYRRGEILELLYFERELMKWNSNSILHLKGEKIKKLTKDD